MWLHILNQNFKGYQIKLSLGCFGVFPTPFSVKCIKCLFLWKIGSTHSECFAVLKCCNIVYHTVLWHGVYQLSVSWTIILAKSNTYIHIWTLFSNSQGQDDIVFYENIYGIEGGVCSQKIYISMNVKFSLDRKCFFYSVERKQKECFSASINYFTIVRLTSQFMTFMWGVCEHFFGSRGLSGNSGFILQGMLMAWVIGVGF